MRGMRVLLSRLAYLFTRDLLGLAGAALAGRAMETVLFDVPVYHLPTLFGAGCVISVMSPGASLLPILRASRVDQMVALRCE
ncbi:MAG TPA: hypothetical protein VJX67_10695 [Blastocatellia bacterium]|nr:hypothetical protein [Blastocatellia bacterium]